MTDRLRFRLMSLLVLAVAVLATFYSLRHSPPDPTSFPTVPANSTSEQDADSRRKPPEASSVEADSVAIHDEISRTELSPESQDETTTRVVSILAYRCDADRKNIANATVKFIPLAPDSVQSTTNDGRRPVKAHTGQKAIVVLTDISGRARATLSAGFSYLVEASASGLTALGFPVFLDEHRRELRIPFTEYLRIEGRVIDSRGKGLPGASLSFCAADIRPGRNMTIRTWGFAKTDSKGHFALETRQKVTGDPYVAVSHSNYQPLVERIPPMRASSYLVLQMQPGIRFQLRVLDLHGKPISGARMTLTQGRYTRILSSSPGGQALDGDSRGLKTFPSLRTSRFGIAHVRGWPSGAPAWLRCAPPVRGAAIVPGFNSRVARPYKRPLRGVLEFVPVAGMTYDLFVVAEGQDTLVVEGKATSFSNMEKRATVITMIYGSPPNSEEMPLRVAWKGDSFHASVVYVRDTVEKAMRTKNGQLPFSIRISCRRFTPKDHFFGPYQLLIDRRITGITLKKDW